MDYNTVALFNGFIREFIDNPLEEYLSNMPVNIEWFMILIFVIKCWPVIMHTLTFGIVGGVYRRGECPILGSFLYLFVHWANNKILGFIVTNFGGIGITLVIIIFLIICLFEFIGMRNLRDAIFGKSCYA